MKSVNMLFATAVLIALCVIFFSSLAQAEVYSGIEFPQGARSFADSVIRYEPTYGGGPGPTDPKSLNRNDATNVPNYNVTSETGYVTLGNGGLIELAFTDNVLTNSGDSKPDLHIFEIGPDVEATFVAIRPTTNTLSLLNSAGYVVNQGGFFKIGSVSGAKSAIDIDTFFLKSKSPVEKFRPGELTFNAVQLIDDKTQGGQGGETPGADIDAVGVISSAENGEFEAQRIKEIAKKAAQDDPKNCSGSVRRAAGNLGILLEGQQANSQVDWMKENWREVTMEEAKKLVDSGVFVVAGLKEAPHGHTTIVVTGPGEVRDSKVWPNIAGGSMGTSYSEGNKTIRQAFNKAVLDQVGYYTPK